MKKISFVVFLLSLSSFSAVARVRKPSSPLVLECGVSGAYFQVWTKHGKKTHYVGGNATNYSCGKDVAAALFGGSFVFFDGQNFHEHYVTATDSMRLSVGDTMAAALIGPYFVFASKDSGGIQEHYITSVRDYATETKLNVSRRLGVAVMGPFLIATNGKKMVDHYVGLSQPQLIEIRNQLVAALMGPNFVVFDGREESIKETYVGALSNPTLSVKTGGTAVLATDHGVVKSYSLGSGRFE